MKINFLNLYEKIKSSLWIVLLFMGLIFFGLALILIQVDKHFLDSSFLADIGLVFSGDAPTAVSILTVLVSSTATIVSLIISMTMVTFTLTSSQYGPRLLRNFISDRTSQNFIGFFIGVFVFSITIVAHISSSEGSFFVPKLSVTSAILLSIFSIILLMFFVNHIAESLRVESIVRNVSEELLSIMDRVFCNDKFQDKVDLDTSNFEFKETLYSKKSGYIQNIDYNSLSKLAKDSQVILKLLCRPGHFIHEGEALISSNQKIDDDKKDEFCGFITLGTFKTAAQDVEYAIDQLVEIALVALSPGVNKTFTAIACIDRLSEAIAKASTLNIASKFIESDGDLTLIKYPIEFDDFVKATFDKIRQDSNLVSSIHMLNSLSSIIIIATDVNKKDFLRKYSKLIYESVDQSKLHPSDMKNLDDSFNPTQILLST